MRKDLIIGFSVSAVVHYSIMFFFNAPPAPPPPVADTADVIKIEMPTLAPDEPEKKPTDEIPDEDVVQSAVAPPSLVDIPNVVPNAIFVMTPEVPPPPGIATAKGVVTIPVNPHPPGWGKNWTNLFNISQLDQIPVARYQPQPVFPYEMKRSGTSGRVTVGFICDSDGNVSEPYVMNSSHREFDFPAIQAVSKWKFKPGRRGGRNVNTRMSQLIEFNITD
jgi:protein TonB